MQSPPDPPVPGPVGRRCIRHPIVADDTCDLCWFYSLPQSQVEVPEITAPEVVVVPPESGPPVEAEPPVVDPEAPPVPKAPPVPTADIVTVPPEFKIPASVKVPPASGKAPVKKPATSGVSPARRTLTQVIDIILVPLILVSFGSGWIASLADLTEFGLHKYSSIALVVFAGVHLFHHWRIFAIHSRTLATKTVAVVEDVTTVVGELVIGGPECPTCHGTGTQPRSP